jgi:hypothetical protein
MRAYHRSFKTPIADAEISSVLDVNDVNTTVREGSDSMRKATLWWMNSGAAPASLPARGPVALTRSGLLPLAEGAQPGAPRVLFLPSGAAPGYLGVALVPAGLAEDVRLGGCRVSPGMHLLRHADCVDFAGITVWISASSSAEEAAYEPAAHGKDGFCARTKARLKPGEPIVICPGTPQAACGLYYKLSAWKLDLQCHGCKLKPSAAGWSPPAPASGSSLDALFQLARCART